MPHACESARTHCASDTAKLLKEARITDHAVASSAAAEQCCVVLQTLCGGVSVTTRFSEPALDAAAG